MRSVLLKAQSRQAPRSAVAALLAAVAFPAIGHAQFINTVVAPEGFTLPCAGIGPLAPIVLDYCVHRTQAEGFVLKPELGSAGLTIGVSGQDDGVLTAVDPLSPAGRAGLLAGDRIVSIDGKPVRSSPAQVAEQRTFGPRSEKLSLTLRRGGETLTRVFNRGDAPEPANAPKSPNILVGVHPVMNWRGVYIPCMGAGPAGIAMVAVCQSNYRKYGYIKTTQLGSTGLAFAAAPNSDESASTEAVIDKVEAGSPADKADIKPGDLLTLVDGKPLTPSPGVRANELIFGKAGDVRHIVAQRAGRDLALDLVLAKSTK